MEDGPATENFAPIPLEGNVDFDGLAGGGLSEELKRSLKHAPRGETVSWGIPFRIGRPVLLSGAPVTEKTPGLKAEWLVFAHTTDIEPLEHDEHGFIHPMRGEGRLGEHVADYVIVYADGS
ncbi:MAG TPA: hypothetical protein ENJ62_04440, partial [Bryobacterales bacterium]|nr:hypothetical protein [Bryobacterales bacterium]